MNERAEAEEHLRIIRTLMERATIYRAISAPTALVGGLAAVLATAASLIWHPEIGQSNHPSFMLWWFSALLITGCANTIFIARAAAARGESLISPSLKLALNALFPPFLTAGVITLVFSQLQDDYLLAVIWTIFYGLALLATRHFSPRSLVVLGWAFLGTGLLAFLIPFFHAPATYQLLWPRYVAASWLMGLTFGLYHLLYAACTWPRRA